MGLLFVLCGFRLVVNYFFNGIYGDWVNYFNVFIILIDGDLLDFFCVKFEVLFLESWGVEIFVVGILWDGSNWNLIDLVIDFSYILFFLDFGDFDGLVFV